MIDSRGGGADGGILSETDNSCLLHSKERRRRRQRDTHTHTPKQMPKNALNACVYLFLIEVFVCIICKVTRCSPFDPKLICTSDDEKIEREIQTFS